MHYILQIYYMFIKKRYPEAIQLETMAIKAKIILERLYLIF